MGAAARRIGACRLRGKFGMEAYYQSSKTLTSVTISPYESINRYTYLVTQQPFELKLTMPPTDRGGRGYSDKYVANAIKELTRN